MVAMHHPQCEKNDSGSANQDPHATDLFIRTSYTDAAIALAQLDKGRAGGRRNALCFRALLQAHLFALGCWLQEHAGKVLFVAILVLASFCVGLKSATTHTRVDQLWVQEGGRLDEELRYSGATLGERPGTTHQMLMQTLRQDGTSLLQPKALLKHLEILQASSKVSVHLFGVTWSIKELCQAPSVPVVEELYVEQIFDNIIPCNIITPLDCFWEGSKLLGPDFDVTIPILGSKVRWTNLNPAELLEQIKPKLKSQGFKFPIHVLEDYMKRAGISTAYQEKPCLDPMDPQCPDSAPNKRSGKAPDVGAELTGGCYGFATKYMHWPEDVLMGGVTRNRTTDQIIRVRAFQSLVELMSEKELYEDFKEKYKAQYIDEWSEEKAAMILDAWQKRFAEEIRRLLNKEMKEVPIGNSHSPYSFSAFSTATLNNILGQFSKLNVLKVAIGYVLMVVYTGVALLRWKDPVRSQAGVGIAGVILVSMTVAAGLGLCALLGIPFNATTTQIVPFLALGLGVDDMFLITASYAEQDILKVKQHERTGTVLKRTGLSVLLTSTSIMCALFAAALIPIPALRVFSMQAAVLVLFNLVGMLLVFPAMECWAGLHNDDSDLEKGETESLQETECQPQQCWDMSLNKVAANYFAPFITKPSIKALAMVAFAMVLGTSVWGAFKVTDGLNLTDIAPQGTIEHAFLSAQSQYFGFYSMHAVTKGDFEYPTNQKLLFDYHDAFMRIPAVIKNDDGGLPDFWLKMFRDWLIGLQKAFDRDWSERRIVHEKWFANASDDGILAYKLLVQTGHVENPIDKSIVNQVRLVDSDGVINPKAFYNYLTAWASNDVLAYGASQANLRPKPREWFHVVNDYDLKIQKSQPLVYAQMPFYLHGLGDTENITKVISQVRALCQKFEERGLPNFPSGIPFLFWEQYIGLRSALGTALACALAAVFLVVSILLLNLWAATLVVVVLGGMVLQLLGLMGILGVKLSAVPGVLLIVAVGIGVHFSVHICLGFVTSIGGRNRRTRLALEQIFAPVVHGALTTLLAVSMLAFSEFDFIVKYFFYVLLSVIAAGLINGLVFLPVLLSLIGPSAEVVPYEFPERISTPSPEPSPVQVRSGSVRVARAPSHSRKGGSGVCHRLHAEPSLSTITEEPGSCHSTLETIVVQPELVLETTTTTTHNNANMTNGSDSGCSERSSPPPGQAMPSSITTKVTATAKVKVELHGPLTSSIERCESRRSSRNRYRPESRSGSSSGSDSDGRPS